MRISIFHGYELTGSGSNEYTRYLARSLLIKGHDVHIICREPNPRPIDFINRAIQWDSRGKSKVLFERKTKYKNTCILHQLPVPVINAVYLTDKQRPSNTKSFVDLGDTELKQYHRFVVETLRPVIKKYPPDILHANHLIYQPVAASVVCEEAKIPFIIYPHGSSIEYVIKKDNRYKKLALGAILKARGLIIGNNEVKNRIVRIYPHYSKQILDKNEIVGVGVDTSLFSPVLKDKRMQSIKKIINMGPFEGKDPLLTEKMFRDLEKIDIYSTTKYVQLYDNNLPDRDLIDHLEKIPWNKNIFIFVGALTVGKGLQSIIAALPFILDKNPDIHLIIIGAGTYREVLEGFAYAISKGNENLIDDFIKHGYDLDRNRLTGPWGDIEFFLSDKKNRSYLLQNGHNINGHIHFLGRMEHRLLRYIFPCADFAIFPSIIPEAYPLVLMEALSNGVFPIVSYFSGFKDQVDNLKEFIDKEFIGLMKISVDQKNRIRSIINCISRVLSEPKIKGLSKKLRKIAVGNFDWKKRAQHMVTAYLKMIIK